MSTTVNGKNKFGIWLRRLGFWGFIFFLAKGIAWLVIGYFALT